MIESKNIVEQEKIKNQIKLADKNKGKIFMDNQMTQLMVEVACKDEDRFKVPYKSMEMPNKKPYLDKNNMSI